jgi:hypothetical protein
MARRFVRLARGFESWEGGAKGLGLDLAVASWRGEDEQGVSTAACAACARRRLRSRRVSVGMVVKGRQQRSYVKLWTL